MDMICKFMDTSGGYLDLLSNILVAEIETKRIPFVGQHMDEGVHKALFNNFWAYFIKAWLNIYNPNEWNVHGFFVCSRG